MKWLAYVVVTCLWFFFWFMLPVVVARVIAAYLDWKKTR